MSRLPVRRHHFKGRSVDLSSDLTEAQLDGRACVHCGAENQAVRPVEAWSELSSQLFECVDVEACTARVADADLEARSAAEEDTANSFFEADQRAAEREQKRVLSLDALSEGEEVGLDMFEDDEG